MQAEIKRERDGSVAMQLDADAARAMFASVLFASQFHDGIAALAKVAEEGLRGGERLPVRRRELCQ